MKKKEQKEVPADKMFYPGLFRANGKLWVADLSNGPATRPQYLINYEKLVNAASKLLAIEKSTSAPQNDIFKAFDYIVYNNAGELQNTDFLSLIEELIECVNNMDKVRDILDSCICRNEKFIDKYMDFLQPFLGSKTKKLFRFNRETLTESLDTTIEVSGFDDLRNKVIETLGNVDEVVKIINEPRKDPRLPSEWGGVSYFVVADIKGKGAELVGMSNFYEPAL